MLVYWFWNLLTCKGKTRVNKKATKGGQNFSCCLIFNKFWNMKIISEWTQINCDDSGNILPKIKDGESVRNSAKYKSIGSHRTPLYWSGENVAYFDSFGVACIPNKIKKFICKKNTMTNIYIYLWFNNVWILLHFCMKGKNFLDYNNLFLLRNMKRLIK